jgi:hypothetical protein
MTSTLFQSAALGRFIAPWATKIVEFLIAIVETILTIAKNARLPWHELGTGCRETERRLSVLRLAPFCPMMAKLEIVGARVAAVPRASALSMRIVSRIRALANMGVDIGRQQPQAGSLKIARKAVGKLSARKFLRGRRRFVNPF